MEMRPQMIRAVEQHPQFARILEAMAEGQSDSEIARWTNPPLNRSTIWRYRKQKIEPKARAVAQPAATVAEALQQSGLIKDGDGVNEAVARVVAATSVATAADPFAMRVAALDEERKRIKGVVEKKEDFRVWASLDGNDIKSTELGARLAGRLDSGANQTQVAIQIVCPAAPSSPALADDGGVTIDIGPGR